MLLFGSTFDTDDLVPRPGPSATDRTARGSPQQPAVVDGFDGGAVVAGTTPVVSGDVLDLFLDPGVRTVSATAADNLGNWVLLG